MTRLAKQSRRRTQDRVLHLVALTMKNAASDHASCCTRRRTINGTIAAKGKKSAAIATLFRCAKRNWRYLCRSRPDLPENCHEILVIRKLLNTIWQFQDNVRPDILKSISQRPSSSYIIRRPNDLPPPLQSLGISIPQNPSNQ